MSSQMCGWCILFFCLKLFAEGGRVGRPLGNLMCVQLCMCMCSCLNITAVVTAATSVTPLWLKAWHPPTLSPHRLPCSSGFISNLTLPTHSLSLCPSLSVSSSTLFSHPSMYRFTIIHFHPPPFAFLHVFISLPLICRVGLPCLSSCSLRPPCCLSLSLWKPRVDKSGSEVCETLIQNLLDHTLASSLPESHMFSTLPLPSASL